MIVAGIVTFEPDPARLLENLSGIAPQVDSVIVYDNGSSNVAEVEQLVTAIGNARVVKGRQNFGVAFALNRIAEGAIARGATALVTLDQDSVCPPEMVAELEKVATDRIGIVTPFIVDRNKLSVAEFDAMVLPPFEFYRQAARRGAITSGSLVKLSVWEEVGGFDERFFIDYVDYDFNQRVLHAGYLIARANTTHLLHEVGNARRTWLRVPRKDLSGRWRLERFYSFGHSPERCYFKARNRVLFTRKHWRKTGITHEGIWQVPQQVVLTLLFEPQRRLKLSAFLRGIRDGVRMPLM
jgi:rhamnosyltransferase